MDGTSACAPGGRAAMLLEPVVYGDVFDHAVTRAEIRCFCRIPLSEQELAHELGESGALGRFVAGTREFFHLEGREHLSRIRREREAASRQAWKTARRVVTFIRHVPFVRGIIVTGSLGVRSFKKGDDMDFLVLVAPGRLWFVFLFLGALQRIASRRYLCPNYYISCDHLEVCRRSPYVARELLQSRPIYGREACRRFYEQNGWVRFVLPNVDGELGLDSGADMAPDRGGPAGWIATVVERAFSGFLGDRIESILRNVLRGRLIAHYRKHGQDVPGHVMRSALEEKELRFHGLGHEERIDVEVQKRTAELMG